MGNIIFDQKEQEFNQVNKAVEECYWARFEPSVNVVSEFKAFKCEKARKLLENFKKNGLKIILNMTT